MKLNAHLVKSTVVAALGGLLFGFDTAVISGTTGGLAQIYQLSPALLGVTVASALWGTILGAILAGIPGERFGRRDSLRIMAILYLISALGCAGAWNWYALMVFRFIGGLGVGGSSVLADVHRGDCTGKASRPAGWILPVQRGVWHSLGIFFELSDRAAALRKRRMAMGTGDRRDSGWAVFCDAVRNSPQPALAGEERTDR